jgi:oxygen-dependent protoporphyrinogen oxidase
LTTTGEHADAAPRIAVIGGGITGLAAAHRLQELLPHAKLALFEASSRLGGILETLHADNFLIERSADNFLTKLPHAVDLCRRLGIADELLSTEDSRRRAFVVKGRQLLPIPDGFYLMSPRKLGPFLKSPLLSQTAKLRALAEPLIPRGPASQNLTPEPRLLTSDLRPPFGDESVASFARRRLGREVFERLVQPLVAGIYTADPEKLSMAATMPEFLAQEREYGSLLRAARTRREFDDSAKTASGARYSLFAAPKQGFSYFISALQNRLPSDSIHLNTRVAAVASTHDGRWHLRFASETQHSALGTPHSSFDALILATPAHAAAKLLEQRDPPLAAALAAIEYAGCAIVSMGFNRSQIAHPLNGFGIVVPNIEHRRIIAASFASQKFPGRAPDEAALIRVFMGGALQPELLQLDDTELRQVALQELSELLGITSEPILTDIARWTRSMPQYHVGHLDRVARIERLTARHPTLALAGNAYHGVGIPQCIASAESATERIAANFT